MTSEPLDLNSDVPATGMLGCIETFEVGAKSILEQVRGVPNLERDSPHIERWHGTSPIACNTTIRNRSHDSSIRSVAPAAFVDNYIEFIILG